MESNAPKVISLEWLENRYGCAAAQDIFEEMMLSEDVANDLVTKDVGTYPNVA